MCVRGCELVLLIDCLFGLCSWQCVLLFVCFFDWLCVCLFVCVFALDCLVRWLFFSLCVVQFVVFVCVLCVCFVFVSELC